MPALPTISGMDARRALEKDGWVFERQRGSHMALTKTGRRSISVPRHRQLKPGTLLAIIKQAELTVAEFVALL